MKHTTVISKVIVGFGILITVIGVTAFYSLTALEQLNTTMQVTVAGPSEKVSESAQIDRALMAVSRAEKNILLAETEDEINRWWAATVADGRTPVLAAYALGKAQRILAGLDTSIGPILTHGAVENVNEVLRAQGLSLPDTIRVTPDMTPKDHPGALVLSTPSGLGTPGTSDSRNQASTSIAAGAIALRSWP